MQPARSQDDDDKFARPLACPLFAGPARSSCGRAGPGANTHTHTHTPTMGRFRRKSARASCRQRQVDRWHGHLSAGRRPAPRPSVRLGAVLRPRGANIYKGACWRAWRRLIGAGVLATSQVCASRWAGRLEWAARGATWPRRAQLVRAHTPTRTASRAERRQRRPTPIATSPQLLQLQLTTTPRPPPSHARRPG